MSLKSILENTPVVASAHIFGGHCKKDNKTYAGNKSYFTDSDGNELNLADALKAVNKSKDKASSLAQASGQAERSIDGVAARAGQKMRLVKSSDNKNVAIAYTDGTQTGLDPYRSPPTPCTWTVFVMTKTMTSGRHTWVTAYPATDDFVGSHLA